MPKICYTDKKFNTEHQEIIDRANLIVAEYQQQGYTLTLRQVFYQFVSRDWLPNTQKSYKRLGGIISDARRAGLLDWDAIEDRTRQLHKNAAWASPADIVAACARQYDIDMWKGQKFRPEAWVEKDALVGVLEVACAPLGVPYFSCRGYGSDSAIWEAGRRMQGHVLKGQKPIVFHLGDHDPSGVDMTRDVREKLELFAEVAIKVVRVALTREQLEQYSPPPNPAKASDSRYDSYETLHGDQSWELDALEPAVITQLIRDQVAEITDDDAWNTALDERAAGRRVLSAISEDWQSITEGL